MIISVAKVYNADVISKDRHFSLLESLKLK